MTQDPSERPRPLPARPPADTKPTPVREVMEAPDDSASEVPAEPEEMSLEVDGRRWTARVLGRSLAGGATHLLLLGFTRDDGPEEAAREGWAVARSLAALTGAQLIEALAVAGPPRDAGKRPFFDEGNRRSRREG